MKIRLPQYNGKDNFVMVVVMIPFAIIINSIIFGSAYFLNWKLFTLATPVTALAGSLDFILCGLVAVALKNRFPDEKQLMKRLCLMIFTFLIISGLYLYSLFRGYENIGFFNYRFNESGFVWSYFSLGLLNVFLTFLMEGISRYKDWKENWQETEKINATYKQSQLHGLKSQVNPHFLFNSLNSLSSLIQDDEDEAEKFLDEMSKVYRYMLRNDDEQLVPLSTELKFTASYMHVLKARYGDGLNLKLSISKADEDKLIAPLTVQVIIENAFSLNIISKASPLTITVTSTGGGLEISNNIQPKSVSDAMDFEAGLDNLIKKYELMNFPVSVSDDCKGLRVISVPLIIQKKEALT
ncbi:MAG: histidine kinase [Chitinophagaceae bacterium]|nr:histidine kinase [Chitinophagaceae bacterium]